MKDFYGTDEEGDKIQQMIVGGTSNEYEELLPGDDNQPEHHEYGGSGYEDTSFGYDSDYGKDTDDLYQFDNQDIAKHEEYSPEIAKSDYEEFMDDVFEQQYDDEDDQKH